MTFADAVTGSDGRPLDQIRLTGVTATGHHGVLPEERAEGQTFRADVVLHLDVRAAAGADDLAATVSYAEVAEDVHDVLCGPPVDLVETLAERIAAVVLEHPAVQAVDVRVHKPEAPIAVPFDDVEIVVRRDREHRPSVPALPAGSPVQVSSSGPAPEPAAPAVPPPPVPPQPVAGTPASAPVPVPSAAVPAPAPSPSAGSVPSASSVPTPAVSVPPAPEGPVAEAPVPAPRAPEPAVPEPSAAGSSPVAEVAIVEPEHVPAPAVDPLDAVPEAPVEAVIALGANLGDAQATLREAVTDIDRVSGVQVMEVSPLARTVAVGPEQPDYLNAVLLVRTTLPARGLLGVCQDVETLHGRVREERWGPRTLDVDLIQYDDLTSTAEDLELPHPRAHERAFVLVPWAEVDPQAVLGGLGGGSVAQLAATAPDRAGIRWLALDWLTGPAATGTVPAQPQPQPQPQPEPEPEPEAEADAGRRPEADPPPAEEQSSPPAPTTSAFPAQAAPPAPAPSADPSAEPWREPSGELPRREPSARLPQRDTPAELPRREPSTELPQRMETSGQVPQVQEPRGFVAAAGVHAPIPPAPDAEHPERS
ncbi:2-amino-4-hydroxy-6-hydroxymethyldihydropteridine diphosphokinase [Isoptericola sediminis]|uniref:Bifunctional folate synthesis protein n=1 Tax=Isoptericola sediminis TaxID=2733572 RepID=A0A849K076_9MICO|nr:2-amino-4-hydroxy-6-hydroxymethyldihydropteridine diphosphokinase [Isoptericola sediminis]